MSLPPGNLPALRWSCRQRRVKADWARVRRAVSALLPRIAAQTGPERDPEQDALWAGGAEISIAVLTDRAIARAHALFLGDPAPTDVITFRHGEILVSAETAARAAAGLGVSTEDELILYIVHGLLHLRGFEDRTPRGAAAMRRIQARLLARPAL